VRDKANASSSTHLQLGLHLVLGMVPLSRICVTPRASLGFHQAYFDKSWTAGIRVTSVAGTDELMSVYPQTVKKLESSATAGSRANEEGFQRRDLWAIVDPWPRGFLSRYRARGAPKQATCRRISPGGRRNKTNESPGGEAGASLRIAVKRKASRSTTGTTTPWSATAPKSNACQHCVLSTEIIRGDNIPGLSQSVVAWTTASWCPS